MVFPEVCHLLFLSMAQSLSLPSVPLYLQVRLEACPSLELSCLATFWALGARELKSSGVLAPWLRHGTENPSWGMTWTGSTG